MFLGSVLAGLMIIGSLDNRVADRNARRYPLHLRIIDDDRAVDDDVGDTRRRQRVLANLWRRMLGDRLGIKDLEST